MEPVTLDLDDALATITLNRPAKRNALDIPSFRCLTTIFGELAQRSDVRVVVLTGTGPVFSAGGDLGAEHGLSQDEVMRIVNATVLALHQLPQPTVAKIQGPAVGAGASIALICDFVIAVKSAFFLQAFIDRGLSADCGGSWTLPRLAGWRAASEMILLGDRVSASQAKAFNMINDVVDDAAALDAAVADLAARLAAKPAQAVAANLRLLRGAAPQSLAEALHREAAEQVLNLEALAGAGAINQGARPS